MKPLYIVIMGSAVVLTAATQAHAQQLGSSERPSYFEEHVAAPEKAVELTVGTGYTQGFGLLERGVGMPDVAKPGFAVDVGAGYRIDPRWAVSANAQYQELQAERATGARGMTADLAAAYHFAPDVRSDPWLQLGSGYRLLWETQRSPAPTVLTHGFQLAKLTAGLDVRFSEGVAIAPMVGADLDVFVWQRTGSTSVAIAEPRASTFLYAGAQGRFDIATTSSVRERTTATRR